MAGLVNQLLLLSRLDAESKRELAPTSLDIVIARAVEMISPLASQHEVTIASTLCPSVVNADESQILQVMLNLLSNAIQFSHQGDAVQVQLKKDESNATISVSDNGVGIAADDIPFLCDRFFQVDQARTTTQSSGAGLGLSIVSEIVKQLNGELSIQSEPGTGTTVQVRIPYFRRWTWKDSHKLSKFGSERNLIVHKSTEVKYVARVTSPADGYRSLTSRVPLPARKVRNFVTTR